MTIAVDDRRLLLFGRPGWVFAGAGVDNYFSQGLNFGGGVSSNYSVTRAQTVNSFASTADGLLVPFAANTPRITNLGWLVEPSRTNSIVQSQALDNASWSKNNTTVTADTTVAPDGTTTADTIKEGAVTGPHGVFQQLTAGAGVNITYSAYVSPSTRTAAYINVQDTSITIWATAVFDLTASAATGVASQTATGGGGGTIVSTSYTKVANGFYRLSMTCSVTHTNPFIQFAIATQPTANSFVANTGEISYAGNITDNIIQWGAQAEISQTSASSYIPTTTVAVARNADNISLTGLAATLLASVQGSLIIWSTQGLAANAGTLLDSNGTVMLGETAGNNLTTAITAGLTTVNTGTWTGIVGSGLAWNASGRTLILNNGTAATDAQATTPATTFHLGSTSGSSAFFSGYIRRVAIFNNALSASNLGPNTAAK